MEAPSPNFLSQTWISGEQLLVTVSPLCCLTISSECVSSRKDGPMERGGEPI